MKTPDIKFKLLTVINRSYGAILKCEKEGGFIRKINDISKILEEL